MDGLKEFLDYGGYGNGYGGGGYGDGGNGYGGNGYGNGDGNGYGGYGNGYGGDGYGYGDGGNGYGGNGYGNGYGDGGDGGDGYGGYGGDGYGIKKIGGFPVEKIDNIPTIFYKIRGNVAKCGVFEKYLKIKKCYVVKGGGFFAHGETLKEANAALQDKIYNNMPVESKIAEFKKEFDKGEKYSVKKFYEWHNRLTGSCEFGRNEFMKNNGITMEMRFTVDEFITQTKNSYGGAIIEQLEKEWNK